MENGANLGQLNKYDIKYFATVDNGAISYLVSYSKKV